MAKTPKILVIGSVNMDLAVRAPAMPEPGETVLGDGFVTNPGGKGANQAVAAARLGAEVRMIGRVGKDQFGETLLANLQAEGIECTYVRRTQNAPTGVAMIVVDANGENSIVVASGANFAVTPDDIFPRTQLFAEADAVLLQFELPLPTARAAIEMARRHRCKVILDPAPAPKQLCDELCMVDIISPNVGEAQRLTGRPAAGAGEERIEKLVAMDLIARGAKAAVLKLGARGSLLVDADGHFAKVPPFRVEVVDTTAAGDAFTAALAVASAEGQKLRHAARFANAAGAIACTRLGAQSAMPTREEVRMLMADQPMQD
ncbi:MAG: ribokinase [Planctomycetota bacterium]